MIWKYIVVYWTIRTNQVPAQVKYLAMVVSLFWTELKSSVINIRASYFQQYNSSLHFVTLRRSRNYIINIKLYTSAEK
jgi:hypothetical protein